jgi:hypothetical protein
MPILGLAPHRHRTVHAQGGEEAWLAVRPLLLALARGHLQGEVRPCGPRRVAPDTARGGSTVHGASFHGNPRARADGTIGPEPPRAKGVAAVADAPHGLIRKGLWGSCLTQEECGILGREALVEAVERAPATPRLQDKAQDDRACVHVPLRGHGVMDEADEAQVISGRLANGAMGDGVHLALRE